MTANAGVSLAAEPTFTTDWSDSIAHWPKLFAELCLVGRPGLRFLEVGCFEGRTTLWLLDHVLTGPGSSVVVIDPFGHDGQLERFTRNLGGNVGAGRATVRQGESGMVLREHTLGSFDFVYIDGDHSAQAVLADAVLAWPLLRPGAAVVFDDYWWPEKGPLDSPGIAVDAFAACYAREIARAGRCGRDQFLVVKASG